MMDYTNARITGICIHQIGSKALDQGCNFSSKETDITDESWTESILSFLLGSFTQPEFFSFISDAGEARINEVMHSATAIFSSSADLHSQSEQLGAYLYELTLQTAIKPGYFITVLFEGVQIQDQQMQALGIYKLDHPDRFFVPFFKGKNSGMRLESGFFTDKPDNGCLIFNTEQDNGYKVLLIEKSAKSINGSYWRDDFLKLRSYTDSFHHTRNFLTLARSFVSDILPEEFEVTRTDQIDYLNRSLGYFKSNDQFNEEEFKKDVFNSPEVIQSFNDYKKSYEDAGDFELSSAFEISSPAVKKQARVFKSVLKLDRNFHIYVHGDRDLIERGVEPDGRKFYKIYYDEES